MQIVTITVRYGRTHSLGNYSNTRPETELTATLEPGEDPAAAQASLLATARQFVEETIDRDLEAAGEPAHFDQVSPRYHVIYSRTQANWGDLRPLIDPPVVAIVPAERIADVPGDDAYAHRSGALRVAHAERIAAAKLAERKGSYPKAYLVDCRDGDLSRLPTRPPADELSAEDDTDDEPSF